jgi:hypothetical protein
MSPSAALLASLVAVLAAGWLAFVVVGTARGSVKRVAWRATLAAAAVALFLLGRRSGLFAQVGTGGQLVLLATLGLLAMSYLYLVRFCATCGRMHRNFKPAECTRCGAPLPDHGLTSRPRRLQR